MRLSFAIATIAALQGAAGVSLAAAAAHADASPFLATASQFLMIHAAAGVGLAALIRTTPRPKANWLAAIALALQAGGTLFASDLAARVFLSGRLFPLAAPIGGGLTILSWCALAVWAAFAMFAANSLQKPPES
ncbi:DUF423 domain-containing protein [Methylocystis sp. H62]|uniref:DUF423 domain-containing protein n=1 Tax=Methylocystis sp. H62 TaxID=2785789 RepID=UPI0018C2108F|nr:DUF423 domain-containing protein [Methylocystis sp. H62]MBG0795840.1 DUF423 domain-containing protein [Methylocystis sp. H62]